MSQTQVFPRLGRIYQHYKGANYKFLLIGRDEETQADLAIYSAVEGGQVWVRPLIEFQPPRFVEVSSAAPSYKPEQILPLLDEVAAAKKRATELQKHDTLTLAEKLDVWRGADQAAANRFDLVAQAYRELVAQ